MTEADRPGFKPGVPRARSAAAPRRPEHADDLGDSLVAELDVPHGGARGLVARLGHDQLQQDLRVAEVGRCGVAELVKVQAADVFLKQDPGAVVAQAPRPVSGHMSWDAGRRARIGLRRTGAAARWYAWRRQAGAGAWAAGVRS